jgi:hypothetical protein
MLPPGPHHSLRGCIWRQAERGGLNNARTAYKTPKRPGSGTEMSNTSLLGVLVHEQSICNFGMIICQPVALSFQKGKLCANLNVLTCFGQVKHRPVTTIGCFFHTSILVIMKRLQHTPCHATAAGILSTPQSRVHRIMRLAFLSLLLGAGSLMRYFGLSHPTLK